MILYHSFLIRYVKLNDYKGNKSDLSTVGTLTKGLQGKLFGDKGYISKDLFGKLYAKDLRLFTGIRKDMKNYLLRIGR
jgi:hypothetical protein